MMYLNVKIITIISHLFSREKHSKCSGGGRQTVRRLRLIKELLFDALVNKLDQVGPAQSPHPPNPLLTPLPPPPPQARWCWDTPLGDHHLVLDHSLDLSVGEA